MLKLNWYKASWFFDNKIFISIWISLGLGVYVQPLFISGKPRKAVRYYTVEVGDMHFLAFLIGPKDDSSLERIESALSDD